MHQLSFLYVLNYVASHLLAVQERGRVAVHMQGTLFTLARLTIVPTIKNLYHILYESILMN